MVQINIKNKQQNCLNGNVEYAIYNKFNERIDLSCCEHVNIKI